MKIHVFFTKKKKKREGKKKENTTEEPSVSELVTSGEWRLDPNLEWLEVKM